MDAFFQREKYRTLKELSADEQKRIEYEAREKALKDYNTQMSSTLARGTKRGEEIGQIEGMIKTCIKFRISRAEMVKSLMEEFALSEKEAEAYMKKYGE